MSIALNAETGKPLNRELTDLEIEYQDRWSEHLAAKRASLTNTARDRACRKPSKSRPGTAERQEEREFYGKYRKADGVCPTCFMLITRSGACTGCFDQ